MVSAKLIASWSLHFLPLTIAADRVLVANTRGESNVVAFDLENYEFSEIIPESAGLINPDSLVLYEGSLYISHGDEVNNSAIFKMSIDEVDGSVTMDPSFASGGGLKRPYGFAFYEETLYVASFRTDQILMYNAITGEFTGVFAQGDATEEGLCNGPNGMDIHEGKLYLTTQGSYIDENGDLQYAFASQIVVYDLATGQGEVFIPQPEVLPGSLGYISMLGLSIQCEAGNSTATSGSCLMYTSDYGGGLRVYDMETRDLVFSAETTYTAGAPTGSLSVGIDGIIYVPAFVNDTDGGVLMAFAVGEEQGMPSDAIIWDDGDTLKRPIGVLFLPDGVFQAGEMSAGELIEPEDVDATEEEEPDGETGTEGGGDVTTEEGSGTEDDADGVVDVVDEIDSDESSGAEGEVPENADTQGAVPEEESSEVVTSSAPHGRRVAFLIGLLWLLLLLS